MDDPPETEPQQEDDSIDEALSQLRKSTSDDKSDTDEPADDATGQDDDDDGGDDDDGDTISLSAEEIERRYKYHQDQAKAYRIAKSKGREPIEATQERLKQNEQRLLQREKDLTVQEHLVKAGYPARAAGLVDHKNLKWDGTTLKNPKAMLNDVQETIQTLTATEDRPDSKQPGKQNSKPSKDIFDDIAANLRGQ